MKEAEYLDRADFCENKELHNQMAQHDKNLERIFEENDQSFQDIMDGYAPNDIELDQFGR